MGKETGIKWTDSTFNSWWGCTKVGPACDDCYAEGVDENRSKQKASDGVLHWGHGAPRLRMSEHTRNEPYSWQRQADKFEAEHGRRRRVFTLSMGDLFDNEVPDDWRKEHFETMEACDRLEWQICTKRVSNIAKMVPEEWSRKSREVIEELPTIGEEYKRFTAGPIKYGWPQHVGVLITVVTQAEADRDVPRLLDLKKRFGIPWVGISYEPAQEGIDWRPWLNVIPVMTTSISALSGGKVGETGFHWEPTYEIGDPHRTPIKSDLDWIIFGGKSGRNWNDRPFSLDWARQTRDQCAAAGVAFFMKQVAAFRPTDDMITADLMVRQWPKGH